MQKAWPLLLCAIALPAHACWQDAATAATPRARDRSRQHRYEDRPIPATEFVLTDHYTEIAAYAGAGHGVKAYPRAKTDSADLFGARTEPEAAAFAEDVEHLMKACGSAVMPAR